MEKVTIMKELIERYQQLNFIDENNRYILEERIKKLEKELKKML